MIRTFDKTSQRYEYFQYIEEHRMNLDWAWKTIQLAIKANPTDYWLEKADMIDHNFMYDLIEIHDISKYSLEEFEPYRQRFFPDIDESYNKDEFEAAWDHHKDNNLHHWQSMEAIGYDHPKIFEYTLEMICDWLAMARKFGEKHRNYYEKNKDNINLQPWQRDLIDEVYLVLDKYLIEFHKED